MVNNLNDISKDDKELLHNELITKLVNMIRGYDIVTSSQVTDKFDKDNEFIGRTTKVSKSHIELKPSDLVKLFGMINSSSDELVSDESEDVVSQLFSQYTGDSND